jgi:polygalacturonase
VSGTIVLGSHTTLSIEPGATVLGSQNPADYPLEPDAYIADNMIVSALICAHNATDVAITGGGTIDGQGAIWWRAVDLTFRKKGAAQVPQSPQDTATAAMVARGRPQLIRLQSCKHVRISDLTLLNSPEWNIHPLLCEDVTCDNLTITSPSSSHNTDGIDPESCKTVRITNCKIDTGDDCIALKSGKDAPGRAVGRPDEDITIAHCTMLHGHGGVTIGSEMSGGVRNVTVSDCTFTWTSVGVRIKSQRGRGGVVEDITESDIAMRDVPAPFVITMFYMGKDRPDQTFPVDNGTPTFRHFVFSHITATGAKTAGSITGLREQPISDITFNNVTIQAGTGFTCTSCKTVKFNDVEIRAAAGPPLTLSNTTDIDSSGLKPA